MASTATRVLAGNILPGDTIEYKSDFGYKHAEVVSTNRVARYIQIRVINADDVNAATTTITLSQAQSVKVVLS